MSVAVATSISRPLPLVSLPRPCATTLAISLARSRILLPKRCKYIHYIVMNHKPHKSSPRHSTQRCSPFSIFLHVIFPSAQRAKICESLLVLTASILTLVYLVTGIVLNRLPQTRSYPTTRFPNPPTIITSASWRSSRSMAVLVHRWVSSP